MQHSSSISETTSRLDGIQNNVATRSPGQIRHSEPSSSSTMWLFSCFLMPSRRSEGGLRRSGTTYGKISKGGRQLGK